MQIVLEKVFYFPQVLLLLHLSPLLCKFTWDESVENLLLIRIVGSHTWMNTLNLLIWLQSGWWTSEHVEATRLLLLLCLWLLLSRSIGSSSEERCWLALSTCSRNSSKECSLLSSWLLLPCCSKQSSASTTYTLWCSTTKHAATSCSSSSLSCASAE